MDVWSCLVIVSVASLKDDVHIGVSREFLIRRTLKF